MAAQYTDGVIAGMQMLYGEGFLSPGGPGEVGDLIAETRVSDANVLDIGCGLGGLALMLVRDYGAAHVTGIDIEDDLIARAARAAADTGLADRIDVKCVKPGPLPFTDGTFDIAITKDVICHVPDKAAFLTDIRRILRPGGTLLVADFFDNRSASDAGAAALYDAYVDGMAAYGLNFHFRPQADYEAAIADAGLRLSEHRDHTDASAAVAKRENETLGSPGAAPIRDALGQDRFEARCRATEMRMRALEARSLLHGHLVILNP